MNKLNERVIKRAVISCSNTFKLDSLVKKLLENDVEIYATSGTSKFLSDKNLLVHKIEELTRTPELFNGRMKTLSFNLCAGILYNRESEEDLKEAIDNDILAIDLVVVNFYSLDATSFVQGDTIIESIDIGGPTLVRAAAKNFNSVCVLSSVDDYDLFLEEYEACRGKSSIRLRRELAIKTFDRIAAYDCQISKLLNAKYLIETGINSWSFTEKVNLKYGENPHQKAFLYKNNNWNKVNFKQLQGKELTYNNYIDIDCCWNVISELNNYFYNETFKKFGACVVKHGNPCGAAVGINIVDTLKLCIESDSTSAFGGVVGLASPVDADLANILCEKFFEIIVAPSFSEEALQVFSEKNRKNLRLLTADFLHLPNCGEFSFRSVIGGILVQECDVTNFEKADVDILKNGLFVFSQILIKYLKSNAILLTQEHLNTYMIMGHGMGQPNRIDALKKLAIPKAQEKYFADFSNMVLISDAFFPFSDAIFLANSVGIKTIAAPLGSIRDNEVLTACEQCKITFIKLQNRHFRH